MTEVNRSELTRCVVETNCALVEWQFENINEVFLKVVEISSSLPRTTIVEQTGNYWHGICRSLIFRFPDDLEVLKLPKRGLIQIKSASRYGVSDLGVNRIRINWIYRKLIKSIQQ